MSVGEPVATATAPPARDEAQGRGLRRIAEDPRLAMPAAAVLAFILALPGVLRAQASLDEGYVFALTRHGLGGLLDGWAEDPQALVPQLLAYPFGVAGDGELWLLRLPSLLAVCATAALMWWAVRPRFDPWVAFGAAMLTAAAPFAAFAAGDARWPALAMLSVVVAWGALLHAVGSPGRRWWALYAAALVVGVYCNPLVLLMVPAHLVAVLLAGRRAYLPWVVSLAVTALGSLPLAAAIRASDAVNPLVRLSRPSPADVPGFAADLLAASVPERLRQLMVVVIVALVLVALWTLRGHVRSEEGARAAIALAWAVLPVAALSVRSQGPDSVWQARYVAGVVPGAALAVAWATSRLPRRAGPVALGVTAAVWAAMSLSVGLEQDGERSRDWSAALAALHEPGTPVVFYEAEGVQAAGLYHEEFRTRDGDPIVPAWDRTPVPPEIVLLDNPTFDRLPAGPPDAALIRRLAARDGTVLLAIRPKTPEPAGVSWARENCEVSQQEYPNMSIYAVTECAAGGSTPS